MTRRIVVVGVTLVTTLLGGAKCEGQGAGSKPASQATGHQEAAPNPDPKPTATNGKEREPRDLAIGVTWDGDRQISGVYQVGAQPKVNFICKADKISGNSCTRFATGGRVGDTAWVMVVPTLDSRRRGDISVNIRTTPQSVLVCASPVWHSGSAECRGTIK